MKIKCPDCNGSKKFTLDELDEHFDSFHYRVNQSDLLRGYAELLFKIHEKIEELETKDYRVDHPVRQGRIRILKSLLGGPQ